jgi:hypothetical protein
VSPFDGEVTCQRTVVGSVPAAAAPIWMPVGCPAATDVAPLGEENPTAGSFPLPDEGGRSAADDAQVGSGLDDSV